MSLVASGYYFGQLRIKPNMITGENVGRLEKIENIRAVLFRDHPGNLPTAQEESVVQRERVFCPESQRSLRILLHVYLLFYLFFI